MGRRDGASAGHAREVDWEAHGQRCASVTLSFVSCFVLVSFVAHIFAVEVPLASLVMDTEMRALIPSYLTTEVFRIEVKRWKTLN